LSEWTPKMRTFKGSHGSHSSIFNQRKKIYMIFKNCYFDENKVKELHLEVKPGKLYKLVSTKKKLACM